MIQRQLHRSTHTHTHTPTIMPTTTSTKQSRPKSSSGVKRRGRLNQRRRRRPTSLSPKARRQRRSTKKPTISATGTPGKRSSTASHRPRRSTRLSAAGAAHTAPAGSPGGWGRKRNGAPPALGATVGGAGAASRQTAYGPGTTPSLQAQRNAAAAGVGDAGHADVMIAHNLGSPHVAQVQQLHMKPVGTTALAAAAQKER